MFPTHVCNTAHFTYDPNEKLGSGATASVYKGHRKSNGQACAVKVLSREIASRNYEVTMRELEVLKKFSHPNIVQLYAIEKEVHGSSQVIIMELCEGGSLLNVLDEPANAYGLEEQEFLCFLRNIGDGMDYLRKNNVVHRDIKPGNIMRSIQPDNSSVYKLTDFGAARELDDINSTFQSIYGTEEYLHPDMYHRALLQVPEMPPSGKKDSYNQKVDLWSLGVTMYHTATGQLPFRPYMGRMNKETMHKMTTEKEPGVISGVQATQGGAIQWSKTLPETSVLSKALKTRVTPMLAGLMECDYKQMWTFDRFFLELATIRSQVPLHVFSLHCMESQCLYMDRNISLPKLTDTLASMLAPGVDSKEMKLLYQGCSLDQHVDAKQKVHSYPPTSSDTPLILVPKSPPALAEFNRPLIAPYPVVHMNVALNFVLDTELARLSLNTTYTISSHLEKFHKAMNVTNSTVFVLRCQAKQQHAQCKQLLKQTLVAAHSQLEYCVQTEKYYKAVQCVLAGRQDGGGGGGDNRSKVTQEKLGQLAETMASVADLKERLSRLVSSATENKKLETREGRMEVLWTGPKTLQKANARNWCGQLTVLKEEMKKLAILFRDRYGKRRVTQQQQELHKCQRRMLHEYGDQAEATYQVGAREGVLAMHENLQQWLKEFYLFHTDLDAQQDAIEKINSFTEAIQQKLRQAQAICTALLEELPAFPASLSAPGSGPGSAPGGEEALDSLLDMSEIMDLDQEQYKDRITQMYIQLSAGVTELESSTGDLKQGIKESTDITLQLQTALERCMKVAGQGLPGPLSDTNDMSLMPVGGSNNSPYTSHA